MRTLIKMCWLNKTFQNPHRNLSENEMGSLFVAKEREASTYPASISSFVLVMENFLVILHYFKMFTRKFFAPNTLSFGIVQFPAKC